MCLLARDKYMYIIHLLTHTLKKIFLLMLKKKYIFLIYGHVYIYTTHTRYVCVYTYLHMTDSGCNSHLFYLGRVAGSMLLSPRAVQLMSPLLPHSFVHFKCDEIFWSMQLEESK